MDSVIQIQAEPEAAEEVKEDKEDDKKGFSMWESISAQVKSVFPAEEAPQSISRQNSPLHVESTKRHRCKKVIHIDITSFRGVTRTASRR